MQYSTAGIKRIIFHRWQSAYNGFLPACSVLYSCWQSAYNGFLPACSVLYRCWRSADVGFLPACSVLYSCWWSAYVGFLFATYCTVVGGPHTWVSCLLHTVQLLVVRIRGVPSCLQRTVCTVVRKSGFIILQKKTCGNRQTI